MGVCNRKTGTPRCDPGSLESTLVSDHRAVVADSMPWPARLDMKLTHSPGKVLPCDESTAADHPTRGLRAESSARRPISIHLEPGGTAEWDRDLRASHGWYDLSVSTERHDWRFAGHIESGHESYSDPVPRRTGSIARRGRPGVIQEA